MNETCEHLSPSKSSCITHRCMVILFISSPCHSLGEEEFGGQESAKSSLPFLCHSVVSQEPLGGT